MATDAMSETMLQSMPDWAHERCDDARIESLVRACERAEVQEMESMDGARWSASARRVGSVHDEVFRRFVMGVFVADLACYSKREHQADFDRLLYVMTRFPSGFRLWCAKHERFGWLPVGYTAWHPVSAATWRGFAQPEQSVSSRFVMPLDTISHDDAFVYLFNFSVIPSLRKTLFAQRIMQKYAREMLQYEVRGTCATTVSSDGIRVVKRFGLEPVMQSPNDPDQWLCAGQSWKR